MHLVRPQKQSLLSLHFFSVFEKPGTRLGNDCGKVGHFEQICHSNKLSNVGSGYHEDFFNVQLIAYADYGVFNTLILKRFGVY